MAIRDRIIDAKVLWQQGRKQGALLSVLIALAATSRKKYPRSQFKDNVAFKRYVLDNMLTLTGMMNWIPSLIYNIHFRGKQISFEAFLYEFLRCELAHNARFPADIKFQVPSIPVPIVQDGCGVIIHPGIVHPLAAIVVDAIENDDEFPNQADDFTDFAI